MSEYRKLLANAKKLVEQAAQERANVVKEGRNEEWNREQYKQIREKYTNMAQLLKDKMFKASLKEAVEAHKAAEKKRKRPHSPLNQIDGAEKLYHLQRAESILSGVDEKQAIEEFCYLVSTLDDKEKPFRFIYEDSLMSKVKEPVNKEMAQEKVMQYKTPEEKALIKDAHQAWDVKELNKTITNHLLHDIDQVTSGKADPPTYEYSEFLDGRSQQEVNQQKTMEAREGLREAMVQNPYIEDTEQ